MFKSHFERLYPLHSPHSSSSTLIPSSIIIHLLQTPSLSPYIMANQPPSCRTAIDIFVSGYLLDEEMLKHLCLLKYGATEAEVDDLGPVDFASLYYAERNFLDAPWLVPITYRSKTDPKVIESGWLIPGKAAFFRPGAEPPQLPYDAETRAYLDTWFPRDLFKRPEFKGVRFVETNWPRDIPRMSRMALVVARSLTLPNHVHSCGYRSR